MVHKPKHKVHSFRGLLGDGGEDEINLERQNVNLAYRVTKFEVFPKQPGGQTQESVVTIYRESQTMSTTSHDVDFDNADLLGAAYYAANASPAPASAILVVTFDNVLFSRNIFVGHTDINGTQPCNYYIEIEEVPVGAATLMQLKLGTARKLIGGSMGK